MNSVFKAGDRVYDIVYGWGKVELIDCNVINRPVKVKFDKSGNTYMFTEEGRHSLSDPYPTLSFTQYDLVNGGFSQVRQIPKDTLVYVRQHQSYLWEIRYFSHFTKSGQCAAFTSQKTSSETNITNLWKYYSFENPLEK